VAQEFGLAAGRYCAFVESDDDLDRDRFVQELERHLVDLYSAALDLRPGEADGPEAAPSMTSTEFRALERRLSEKLGDSDVYWVHVRSVRRRHSRRCDAGRRYRRYLG
jgi:hypothetical protein